MFIFNTTFLVSDRVFGTWTKWLREEYIPFATESGALFQPQVAKVLAEEPQDGTSFSVQFHVNSMEALQQWRDEFETLILHRCTNKFAQEVLLFSTVLELIS